MRRAGVSCLHGEDDLLCLGISFVEIDSAVNAFVRALLLLDWTCADKTERPPLELILVTISQVLCVGNRGRLADHLERLEDTVPEGVLQAMLDEGDCEVSNVDADPFASKSLSGCCGGSASTERIKDNVS